MDEPEKMGYAPLSSLPPFILGTATILLIVLNTLVWSVPGYTMALVKFIIRRPGLQPAISRILICIVECWLAGLMSIQNLTQHISWDIEGLDGLNRNGRYFIICNHQSWTDIMVLLKVFHKRIPFIKFFLKRELFWLPVFGTACWSLDFPYLMRYSEEYLLRHPDMRGKDLETIAALCERYKDQPIAILNFLEGTRFTTNKQQDQLSPYRHLLRPRAGGLATALFVMGGSIRTMIDTTIVYPERRCSFIDFLTGSIDRVTVRIRIREIPAYILHGDYRDDPKYRSAIQDWVNDLWLEKDVLMGEITDGDRGSC
ncbi:MAG TPA: acyltransferase [Deltaproteobacteria bacterium]|nr:acyltransferase [Deltaproteobacteria bacterium]